MTETAINTEDKPKKNQAKEYLKGWVPYRIKRYWAYVAATIIALVMPWITIGAVSYTHLTLPTNREV